MTGTVPAIVPVILSGGSGSRLWPLSRECYPKQLLPLLGGAGTMLQQTAQRVAGLDGIQAPVVVCNQDHRFLVAEQLRAISEPPAAILLEPVGRNTAPAVAVAALQVLEKESDALLLVMPADHRIADDEAFRHSVRTGLAAATEGKLVTFGVVPTTPETGYGYIRAGGGDGIRAVERFVEKPDAATAKAYLDEGGYYWNSGMFLFSASSYLQELERLAPDMVAACREAHGGAQRDLDFVRLHSAFESSPSDSVDYAVMEKTRKAVVVALDSGWSDVGSWNSLFEVGEADVDGNVLVGDVHVTDTRGSYVRSQGRLVEVLGMEDVVVVDTTDALLVTRRDRAQDIKDIVERLQEQGRPEAVKHRRVSRPWGSYEGIAEADRFQVKRIIVEPGHSLSLQMHHHRAEHWVIVRGTARVTRGDETFLVSEDQSTYIPLGTVHRLENPGRIPLELIEVQTGSYLGEDDITRLDDRYGR